MCAKYMQPVVDGSYDSVGVNFVQEPVVRHCVKGFLENEYGNISLCFCVIYIGFHEVNDGGQQWRYRSIVLTLTVS